MQHIDVQDAKINHAIDSDLQRLLYWSMNVGADDEYDNVTKHPAKRVKIENNETINSEKPSLDPTLIPIARVVFHLRLNPDTDDQAILDESAEHDCDVVLCDFRVDADSATMVLAKSRSKSQLQFKVSNTFADADRQYVTQLLAATRKVNSGAKVDLSLRLIHNNVSRSSELILDTSMYWRDGRADTVSLKNLGTSGSGLLCDYFSVPSPPRDSLLKSGITPQDFYNSASVTVKKEKENNDTLRSVLETPLYPFQLRAVQWMLEREAHGSSTSHLASQDGLLFRPVKDADGEECFINDLECILSRQPNVVNRTPVLGGILAEEMGLGKTCEVLAVINSHRRTDTQSGIGTTLIVTPQTILQQWKDEISKHAPDIVWAEYGGINHLRKSKQTVEEVVRQFTEKDLILTTYQTLAADLDYATDPPKRNLRQSTVDKKQPRPRSPLVKVNWWRVCLDEAQMVESGVSRAAMTASLIPRTISWAISGTPVKKDIQDLRGLLLFLRYEPFASSPDVWRRLISSRVHFHSLFTSIFKGITLRHTKDKVRNELTFPPQRRIVVTVPFTAVEEQNYNSMFDQMAAECGVHVDGSPKTDDWDPNDYQIINNMRQWLLRLRQTCLHPQVGGKNRRALGRKEGAIRTVEEVLGVMLEQNESSTRTESRNAIAALGTKAFLVANAENDTERSEHALPIYQTALQRCQIAVAEDRAKLEAAKLRGHHNDMGAVDEGESNDVSKADPNKVNLRSQLRDSLELEHKYEFFVGTAYYQIKTSKEHPINEKSDAWKNIEEQEINHYDRAKVIRKEYLRAAAFSATEVMKQIKLQTLGKDRSNVVKLSSDSFIGGIEVDSILNQLYQLAKVFEDQDVMLLDWQIKLEKLLISPLVDTDDGEITGDEYEDSAKAQDQIGAYFDALRALLADRTTCINGQINTLINHEAGIILKGLLAEAKQDREDGKEPVESREFAIELLRMRFRFQQSTDPPLSLRALIHNARSLENRLVESDRDSARVTQRARNELHLVKRLLKYLQSSYDELNKQQSKNNNLLGFYKDCMNQRIEYYRQLQVLSDGVRRAKEELDPTLDQKAYDAACANLERCDAQVATLRSKRRFLLHIKDEANNESQRICVICQSNFEQGVLTVCGHQFCKECIGHWWREHRTCPVCKRSLKLYDFHDITYRPQDMTAHEESHSTTSGSSDKKSGKRMDDEPKIYADMSVADLTAIKSIELPVSHSFGTKIDTISRHLLYIRNTCPPGTKTLIFSQYREFLEVLSSALNIFSISHVTSFATNLSSFPNTSSSSTRIKETSAKKFISISTSINSFVNDPQIEVFLLDARTDSSGLNLVAATNVILCEPLVNPAIELQAIARVHRIGQTRETKVFMYLVSGTVEEGIYELSVQRRLEHIRHNSFRHAQNDPPHVGHVEKAYEVDGVLDVETEEAERMELQAGQTSINGLLTNKTKGKGFSGENVKNEDLWYCLFGGTERRERERRMNKRVVEDVLTDENASRVVREEVGRFVRADAHQPK